MRPDCLCHDIDWPAVSIPATSESSDAGERLVEPRARVRHARPGRGAAATLRLVRRYAASAPSVFAAWTDPAVAGRWLLATAGRPMARTRIDARVGGQLCLTEQRGTRTVEHRGEYLELQTPRRLAFVLCSPDLGAIARIAVDIEARRRGCTLTLVHANARGEDVSRVRQRWVGLLYGLGATLEQIDANPHRNPAPTKRSLR
jgi:uncharacterized protein YndB with AHSA1/START domain